MTFLKVSGITKKGEEGLAVDGISFSQRKRENIAIVGETGSGKSTLLKIIAGLLEPDTGEVCFENERVEGPEKKLIPGHRGVGYLSQDFELPKNLTVAQLLRYANIFVDEGADFVYDVCRISHLLNRKSDQLSGGERQRIALARQLVSAPRLLLLDEAFSNLDRAHKVMMKKILEDIADELKISYILISHDPEDILSWAHRVMVMKNGRIIQKGTPEKIYRQPVNEYVAGLFGTFNKVDPGQKALVNIVRAKKHKRELLIRGEQFVLGPKRKKSIQGRVIQIKFYGSYYELDINCSGTVLTIKTQTSTFTEGDPVYVSMLKL